MILSEKLQECADYSEYPWSNWLLDWADEAAALEADLGEAQGLMEQATARINRLAAENAELRENLRIVRSAYLRAVNFNPED